MAGGAGEKPAARVAPVKQGEPLSWRGAECWDRQGGIISGHRPPFVGAQPLGDPAHLRMVAPVVSIGIELPLQIARIQAREARRPGAVAAAIKAVAGKAGVGRPGAGPAVCDDPPVLREPIEGGSLRGRAPSEHGRCGQKKRIAHKVAIAGASRWFPLAALALAACKPPPEQRQFVATADAADGKAAIQRAGCGSCHTIPGIRWPKGKVGPVLDGLAERALIAGNLPNQPDALAAYIRNAPALVPGSSMPAMPVSEAEARDIAAYLYEQGAS